MSDPKQVDIILNVMDRLTPPISMDMIPEEWEQAEKTGNKQRRIIRKADDLMIALGFEPRKVRRVILDMSFDKGIAVHTEQYLDEGQLEIIKDELHGLAIEIIKVQNKESDNEQ